MRMKSSILMIVLSFLAVIPVLSQDNSKKTFATDDQTFSFDIPSDWTVEVVNPEYGPNAHLSVDNLPLDQRFESVEGVNLQIWLPTRSFQISGLSGKTFKTPREAIEGILPGTPQPLNLQPAHADINDFTVDGRPAAYGYSTMEAMNIVVSQMVIVADLGEDYWVSLSASSFKGGLATLQKNETLILDLVKSMRYAAKIASSGNPDLPQVYSGFVGIWQQGYIKFYYPEDWYVTTPAVGIIVISNRAQNAVNVQPEAGQFIAQVTGVAETRASADPSQFFNQCDFKGDDLTAREVTEKILNMLTPSRLEQLKQAGITMTQPEVITVNGKELVYVRQYQADLEVISILVDLGHGYIPSLTLTAKKGEVAQFEKQLFAMAGTFEYTTKPCEQPQ